MVTPPAEKQCRRLCPPLASGGWAGMRGLHCLESGSGLNAPEGNQSELIWASEPDCGIATTRKALRHRQAHSQNKGQNRTSRPADLPPLVTGSQNWKGAIAAPERHYLPNCKQAPLLTKTSWGSGKSSAWEGAMVVHPENQAAGTGEAIGHSDRTCQTPHHPSCSELGRAQNASPTESVPLRTTWAA